MGRVSQLQLYMLYSLYLFTSTIGFEVGPIIEYTHFAAWVSIILGALAGLVITYGSFRLAIRRPSQFLGNYGKDIIGKWLHYPLITIMIFTLLFTAAVILRQLQELVIQVYLPNTPQWAVSSLFGLCIAFAVRSGVEVLFRAAQGFFFISIVGILIIPMIAQKEINYDMAIALVNHMDPAGIWNGSYFVFSLYGELAFILILIPYIENYKKTMKSLSWATVTSIFIILSNLIPIILIFGPGLPTNLTYPELELLRFARTGTFLENLDPVLIAIWTSSLFIKISLLLFAANVGLSHTFSLKDHKPFSFLMTAILVGLSLYMVRSQEEFNHFLKHGWVTFLIMVEMIPILYLTVDYFRSPRKKRG